MRKIISDVKLIGIGLAVLYAVSVFVFLGLLNIPEYEAKIAIYFVLFVGLFFASLAVALLKEWGRKLIIVLNGILFIGFLSRYIPQIDLVPMGYFLMSFIIFMYFNQEKVSVQFHQSTKAKWKSILVVDDDEIHLKTIRPILISQGYSVLTADSGEYGLQIAKTQKPDLVSLDVILPGMKGREVCKRLKEDSSTENIPVIFLTSKDSPDDIKAEMDVGGLRHLTKPVSPKALIATVKEILE